MTDDDLLALRPRLDLAPGNSPAEAFQNATLRPLLKLQHGALARGWHRYADKQKGRFYRLNRPEQRDYLRHAVRTNRDLRAYLLATVTALMTADEWRRFRTHESELARRLYAMATERLESDDAIFAEPASDRPDGRAD